MSYTIKYKHRGYDNDWALSRYRRVDDLLTGKRRLGREMRSFMYYDVNSVLLDIGTQDYLLTGDTAAIIAEITAWKMINL